MSASCRSEPRRGLRLGAPPIAALAALACLLLAHDVAWPQGRSATVPDSGSRVSRIRVGEDGISVNGEVIRDSVSERRSRRDRRLGWREGPRVRTRIGDARVEIDDPGTGIVRIWSDAYVPAGEVVDGEVVAVFGSVTVAGTVSRDVVAVLGNVKLKRGARVDGDVVSVGGSLEQEENVTIKGESVQLGFTPITWGLPTRSVLIFAVVAGWLMSMFIGWIFALLFHTGMLRVATVVERRPAASFFVGLLSVPLFLLTLVLLCITVIGIPIAILLPMLFMLMGYAGQLAATTVLGARLARRPLVQGLMVPLLVGTLFVAVLLAVGVALMSGGGGATQPLSLFLSLSGLLLLLGLGSLGTGAFLLSRFGTRPRDVAFAPAGGATSPLPGTAPPTSF